MCRAEMLFTPSSGREGGVGGDPGGSDSVGTSEGRERTGDRDDLRIQTLRKSDSVG